MNTPSRPVRPARERIRGTHRQTLWLLALAGSCLLWLLLSVGGALH